MKKIEFENGVLYNEDCLEVIEEIESLNYVFLPRLINRPLAGSIKGLSSVWQIPPETDRIRQEERQGILL